MAPPVGVEMSAGNAVGRGELCRILLIDCARLRGKVLYSKPTRKCATARGLAKVTRSYLVERHLKVRLAFLEMKLVGEIRCI